MNNQSINYQELELMLQKQSNKKAKSSFASELNRIWNGIVQWITTTHELTIDSHKDKFGNTYWTIHDPLLGHKISFDSETEVRIWLDGRYYQ